MQRVDDIAIVGQSQGPCRAIHHERLRVAQFAAPGGGITGVANSQFSGKRSEVGFAENLGDQAHLGVDGNSVAAGGRDAGAFLAAVLEGEEAEEGEAACALLGGIYSDYPAFLARTVERAIDLGEVRLTVHGVILSALVSCGQQLIGAIHQLRSIWAADR